MTIPRVYSAIAAVSAELARSGIAKAQLNVAEQYAYRGIDDVTHRLAPILAQHRLCILPRVLERSQCERRGSNDALLISVSLRVALDIVSAEDGSSHTIESWGEALDGGDKATAKAMTAAYKSAVLQAFCIPVTGSDETEAATHRLVTRTELPDPDQGWQQWGLDIADMISVCESVQAVALVQDRYRALLRAASKRAPQVYAAVGETIARRRRELAPPASAKPRARARSRIRPEITPAPVPQPQAEVAGHA